MLGHNASNDLLKVTSLARYPFPFSMIETGLWSKTTTFPPGDL